MKEEQKEWVYAVFCRKCEHLFYDSYDRSKAKSKKWETGFICPFCGTKLWIR